LVVAKAGARIELLITSRAPLYDLERAVQGTRDFFQLIGLNLLQVFGDDLLRKNVCGSKA